MPAETFDNVKGKFPIGFTIWNTAAKKTINTISTDVYDKNGNYKSLKLFYGNLPDSINKWIVKFQTVKEGSIGTLFYRGNDFQNQNFIYIDLGSSKAHDSELYIKSHNLITTSIYFSVRHSISASWLNDRDQFLLPSEDWKGNHEFQNDCLAFTLFHGQNKITNSEGINHWIPFTEQEVNAKAKFESNFMTDFIKGKIKKEVSNETLFKNETIVESKPLVFSDEATEVFDSGRELWKYYHAQNDVDINVNASFYDIRAYFQGTNALGRMNARSENATYTKLIGELRNNLSVLADKIKPKVYEYEFLKE